MRTTLPRKRIRLKVVDANLKSSHLCDQRAPCQLGWRQRAAILAAGFLDMASPAKCLQAIDIERVLARFALQRRDVIHFQAPGSAALDAPVVVALEYGAADGVPQRRAFNVRWWWLMTVSRLKTRLVSFHAPL